MKIRLILTILLLIVLTSEYSFGQIKLEDLQIDSTITGFHYAADFQGTIVFTKNGASDIQTINPTAFSFSFAQNMTAIEAKKQLEMLLIMSKQNGYEISNFIQKDTVLNNNIAYYISYTETDVKENYQNIVYNAFVIKDKTLILFVSGDLDRGKYLDKFKKTFYSIKI
jgi:hypothetical protein